MQDTTRMPDSQIVAFDPAVSGRLSGPSAHSLTRAWPLGRLLALSWEVAGMLLMLAGGTLAHAYNLLSYPRYQLDEGTYVASAWAVAHGQIYPYTYTYGHPPLGWVLMALWIQATGGFFSFGTAIDTGRVFMVAIFVLSALLVYLIARRLTGSPWAALLAMALFSLSPLSVNYQREVLLDNIATFWMLLALYLLVACKSRMRYVAGSALAFGIAFLSKETMIVFFPVFAYGAWLQASRFQRRFVLIVFCYTAIALVSTFLLLAVLKGELFPYGTLLGGSHPHVSLISSYLQQAARGSAQGSFQRQWASWWHDDAPFMVAGLIALAGNLLSGWRRRPWLQVIALLSLVYWLFLARGGVTLAYYLLPLIPLQALNIALFVATVVANTGSAMARVYCRWRVASAGTDVCERYSRLLSGWFVAGACLGLLVVLIPHDLRGNQVNLTVNATAPEVDALRWIGAHVPRSALIVANHYDWVDLHAEGGLGVGNGVPFSRVEMYWEVATDPAISQGVLNNNWDNIDYVIADSDMMTDARNFHMGLILDAFAHSVAVRTFQNNQFWVTIYRVQHTGPAPINGADPGLLQELSSPHASNIGAIPSAPATTMAVASPALPAAPAPTTDNAGMVTSGPGPAQVTVIAPAGLNVRAGPGLSFPILAVVSDGTVLPVLGRSTTWIRTSWQGQPGWIAGWWTKPPS